VRDYLRAMQDAGQVVETTGQPASSRSRYRLVD
jgi:hypothetical protein